MTPDGCRVLYGQGCKRKIRERRLGRTPEEDPKDEHGGFGGRPLIGHLATTGPIWAEPLQTRLGRQSGEAGRGEP